MEGYIERAKQAYVEIELRVKKETERERERKEDKATYGG